MAELNSVELARLQHEVLAAALDRGALPDLHLTRSAEGIALSRTNLAEPVDLSGLSQPVRLVSSDASGAAHLAFAPPSVEGDEVTLALQVRASPPQGGGAMPLSAVTLRFRRTGGDWAPAGPPAALST
jgi:hypothetical protein